MHIVLIIFRYFPHGGLQRDMHLIAKEALSRGHSVSILCQLWSGDTIKEATIITFPPKRLIGKISSPRRNKRFFNQVKNWLNTNSHEHILGMNKMPFLDSYYQGDECFAHVVYKERPVWYRYTFRAKHFLTNERAVFRNKHCQLFMLSKHAVSHFIHHYGESVQSRMCVLKPGLPNNRIWHSYSSKEIKANNYQLLFVASNFWLKGLDRVLRAISELDKKYRVHLTVVGGGRIEKFRAMANKNDLPVTFTGASDKVIQYMRNSDILVHPARMENAGMVLIEALANALPVLTTENCGYAALVKQYHAGKVISHPFSQGEMNKALLTMLERPSELNEFSYNAHQFGKSLANTTIAKQVIDHIEKIC